MEKASNKKLSRNPERNENETMKIPPRNTISEQRTSRSGARKTDEMMTTGNKTLTTMTPSSVNETGCL